MKKQINIDRKMLMKDEGRGVNKDVKRRAESKERKNNLSLHASRSTLYVVSLWFLVCGLILLLSSVCFAKEIGFEAAVDRNKVSLGGSVQLSLTFEGTQNIPPVELPKIKGVEIRYLGPSTRMSIVNGNVTSSVTHIYTVVPLI